MIVLFGVSRLFLRRHPRWMMRVRPTRLLLWSLLMATAHGAALMLLPFLMGICSAPTAPAGASTGAFEHESLMALMRLNVGAAVVVSLLHSAAMMFSGLTAAWVVYRFVGLRALRTAWLNLDIVWALCLTLSGGVAIAMALFGALRGGRMSLFVEFAARRDPRGDTRDALCARVQIGVCESTTRGRLSPRSNCLHAGGASRMSPTSRAPRVAPGGIRP